MVTKGIRSASSVSAEYGYEAAASFQTETSVYNLFGRETKVNGLDWKNNQQPLSQLNTTEITDFLYNRNEGSCSIDYIMSNPWVFSSVLNKWYSASGSFIHIWSSDPTLNTLAKTPRSETLRFIARLGSGNVSKLALGAICPSITIRTGIDQPVAISQQFNWGKETVGSTGTTPASENAAFTPFNFVNAQVQLPDLTPIADVQSINMTIDNGYTLLGVLNSANAGDLYSKLFSITGTVNLALQDATFLNDVVGRAAVATMGIDISNGSQTVHIQLNRVGLSSDKWDGLVPADLLTEEFAFQAQDIKVTSTTTIDDPNAGAF